MAKYVDGFVLPISKKKRDAYKKMAKEGRTVWMKFGALDYKECRADDVTPSHVAFTFPKMAKAKKGEEIWFSFITFKSKKHRNEVNKKVMEYFNKKICR
jgi:uncharacterized protein YbaA (DUF1428 family)